MPVEFRFVFPRVNLIIPRTDIPMRLEKAGRAHFFVAGGSRRVPAVPVNSIIGGDIFGRCIRRPVRGRVREIKEKGIVSRDSLVQCKIAPRKVRDAVPAGAAPRTPRSIYRNNERGRNCRLVMYKVGAYKHRDGWPDDHYSNYRPGALI